VIERLLAADAALERGDLELAARLFTQVADADGRNAIAVVGLARIALVQGDREGARAALERALEIDPDEAAAQRLLAELAAERRPGEAPVEAPAEAPVETPVETPVAEPAAPPVRPSLLERLRRWLRMSPRHR
jgi:tetratricopeptide (TPR) repeat protein